MSTSNEPREPARTEHSDTGGLWHSLVGGVIVGAFLLGLLVAAYAVGFDRGVRHERTVAIALNPAKTSPQGTAPKPSSTTPAVKLPGPVQPTAALVTLGKQLYTSNGCSACHTISGASGVGPTWKGLAGSRVSLTNGQTVTATDAFLEEMIMRPGVKVVKGFPGNVMGAAISQYNLASKPSDVKALVAYIKSLR